MSYSYITVYGKQFLDHVLKMPYVAIDTETISLDDKTLVGFSLAWRTTNKASIENQDAVYVPIKDCILPCMDKSKALKLLQYIVDYGNVVFHNSSFDLPVLAKFGVDITNIDCDDTLLMANLYDENIRHGLKGLVKRYFHYHMQELKEICGTGKKYIPFCDVEDKTKYTYARDDAYWTLKLFYFLRDNLLLDKKVWKVYTEIEKPLLPIVAHMHINGMNINVNKVKELSTTFEHHMNMAQDKLDILMGEEINLNSPKQLKEYFIGKLNMPIIKRSAKTNQPSVDKEVLEQYAETCNEAKLILEYRKYAKLYSTFIPAITPKDFDIETMTGKIYPSFNQAGTTSGRFSSSRPNMQNIPHDDEVGLRDTVIADKGHVLVGADYSQIELRVLAHFSQDFNLMKAYINDLDIHQQTADALGIDRYPAKTINFGLVYGMGAKTLSKKIDVSYDQSAEYIGKYFETYSGVKTFWESTENQVKEIGFVETFFGRKRRITKDFHAKDDFDKSREVRSLINAIIQGTAADVMKRSIAYMYPKLNKCGARIVSTIHDEILVSCPKASQKKCKQIITEAMVQGWGNLSVPIKIDCKVGNTWGMAH